MTTVRWHDSTTGLHQPKVIDNEVFLCQSAAEPEERMHDLDLRTAPQENPQCSQPFLPRLSPVGPTDCQTCHGLTEARTNFGSQDLDSLARLTDFFFLEATPFQGQWRKESKRRCK